MLQPGSSPLSQYEFDVLISAGGGRFVPEGKESFEAWIKGIFLPCCFEIVGKV